MRNLKYATDQLRLLVADHLILSALKIAPKEHRDTLHIARAMHLYSTLRAADIAADAGKGKNGQRSGKAGPGEKLTIHELASLFPDGIPMLAVKLIFPEQSAPLTIEDIRQLARALSRRDEGSGP